MEKDQREDWEKSDIGTNQQDSFQPVAAYTKSELYCKLRYSRRLGTRFKVVKN